MRIAYVLHVCAITLLLASAASAQGEPVTAGGSARHDGPVTAGGSATHDGPGWPSGSTAHDGPGERSSDSTADHRIFVRYFHPTIRCVTCLSIEHVTGSTVAERYADDATVVFQSWNIDEPECRAFVEQLHLTGSALFICRDGRCTDLTGEAFAYALGEVGRLPQLVIDTVEELRRTRR